MKKYFIVLLIPVLLLVSCSKEKTKEENIIYTSIYPVEYLTKEIVGNKMQVKQIVPNGADAHSWEPTMKDIASMSDAKITFLSGLGMESWKETILNSIDKEKVKEINKNIDYINISGKLNNDDDDYDPHIWLSPKNMKIMAENIYNEIIKIDPKNKLFYKDNLNGLKEKLAKLDKNINDELIKYHGKSIIVPHEAFGYFTRDYKLTQVPIENINSSSEPDLGRIAEIVDIAKKDNINTVFYEYNESKKLSENIAKEINGSVKEIYTIENITKEQIENNDDYITLMEKNLNNILESFK